MAGVPLLAIVLAGCGRERNMDNPPPSIPSNITVMTTAPVTTPPPTAFVPTTAVVTAPPPTAALPTSPPPTSPPATPPPPTSPPPPTIPDRYTVVAGDTLSGIARRLGVTLDALLAVNGMTASSLIVPGQQLAVPQGGQVPGTNAPGTNAPATNAPATNPPATNAPATNPPATDAPATNPPATDAPQPTTTLPAAPNAVTPTQTDASCVGNDGQEANGAAVSFAPGNLFDRNPATAWRCDNQTTGSTVTFSFDGPTHLTSVGLINGYVKVDALTGRDRYLQNHRIRQVNWVFTTDAGDVTVTQDFADGNRGMQLQNVDVTATAVRLEITATYPPTGEDTRNSAPIAEVQFTAG